MTDVDNEVDVQASSSSSRRRKKQKAAVGQSTVLLLEDKPLVQVSTTDTLSTTKKASAKKQKASNQQSDKNPVVSKGSSPSLKTTASMPTNTDNKNGNNSQNKSVKKKTILVTSSAIQQLNHTSKTDGIPTTASTPSNKSKVSAGSAAVSKETVPVPISSDAGQAKRGMFKLPAHILQQALNLPPTPPSKPTSSTPSTTKSTSSSVNKEKQKNKKAKATPPPVVQTERRQPRAGVDYPKSQAKQKESINMQDYIDDAARQEMKLLKTKSMLKHYEAEVDHSLTSASSPDAITHAQQTLFESYITALMLMNSTASSSVSTEEYCSVLQRALDYMQKLASWWNAVCVNQHPQQTNHAMTISASEALALLLWNVYDAIKQHPSFITELSTSTPTTSSIRLLCSQLFGQFANIFTTMYYLTRDNNQYIEAQHYLHLAISLNGNQTSLFYQRYLLLTLHQQQAATTPTDTTQHKLTIVELLRKRIIALLFCQIKQTEASKAMTDSAVSYHEVLTEILEHSKYEASTELQAISDRASSNRPAVKLINHYYQLHLSALICIAMIYTRVDVDKCTDYLQLMKTQVVMMLQLFTQLYEDQYPATRSKRQSSSSEQWLEDEVIFNGLLPSGELDEMMKKVEDCCYDLLLIMLLLLQCLAQKHRLTDSSSIVEIRTEDSIFGYASTQPSGSWNDAEAQHIGKQHLLQMQSKAGVIDSLRAVTTLVSAFVFGSSASVHATAAVSSMHAFHTKDHNHLDNATKIRLIIIAKSMHLFTCAYPQVTFIRYIALLLPQEYQQVEAGFQFLRRTLSSKVVDQVNVDALSDNEVGESLDCLLLSDTSTGKDISNSSISNSALQKKLSKLPEEYSNILSAYEHRDKLSMLSTLLRWQHIFHLYRDYQEQVLILQQSVNKVHRYIVFDQQRKAFFLHQEHNIRILGLLNNASNRENKKVYSRNAIDGIRQPVSTSQSNDGSESNANSKSNFSVKTLPKRNVVLEASFKTEEPQDNEDIEEVPVEAEIPEAVSEQQIAKKVGVLTISSTITNKKAPKKKISNIPPAVNLPLIVLDAANIAMRHGLNHNFSCQGIQLVMQYFLNLGHKIMAFLPDYYMNYDRVGALRKLTKLSLQSTQETKAKIPDNISLLERFIQEGWLVCTPPQDYDDIYCIDYAQRHRGYIITNDLYRDYVERQQGKQREEAKKWIKEHCVSFTFVANEFMPNPQAKFVVYS